MATPDRTGPTIMATTTLITVCGGRILYSGGDLITTTFTDMIITLLNSADLQAGARQGFTAEDFAAPLPVADFMEEEEVTEAAEATDNHQP